MAIQVVILAAGQGKRMHSDLPKMLHCLAGKPLLEYVIQTALSMAPETPPIVIYGHEGERIQHAFAHYPLKWVKQETPLGTGHAVEQALPSIADADHVLILCGDAPLTSTALLKNLVSSTPKDAIGMVTVALHHPSGYGRIKRNQQQELIGIVEEKDATPEEKLMMEINPGIYYVPMSYLKKWLPKLTNKNNQQEYYLTDIVSFAVSDHVPIHTIKPLVAEEVLGVNDGVQLAFMERFYQRQYAEKLMRQGVTLYDPARLDVRGELSVGRDVVIDVNVIIEGRVTIGHHCVIGSSVILRNTLVGDHVEIKSNSIIDGAEIAAHSQIGPFARLRPGTVLEDDVHIGNFVEVKNSHIGAQSKVNHLSYIGDSELGRRVNIGAGTITCNYDGVNKHKTIIGDDVHIGSDTQLVAPITIGDGATIAAGSTLTKDAPANQLTLTHELKQRTLSAWKRPEKAKS